jgi:dipeptidyl aminopeptidase/acylaminoacyl peptidase
MTHPRFGFVPAFAVALALTPPVPAADPPKVTGANYPLAQKFTREFVARNVQEASVSPQWIGKTDQFWYQVRTPAGLAYWRVDPARPNKEPLFDPARVAAALSEVTKKPLDAATLALGRVSVTDDGKKLKFVFDEYQYEYDLAAGTLTKGAKAPRTGFQPSPEMLARMTEEQRRQLEEFREREQRREDQQDQQQQQQQQQEQQQQQGNQTPPPAANPLSYKAVSPDKKKYVYAFKHNLYLADEGAEDKAVQLTKDGVEDYSFGPQRGTFGRGRTGGSEAQAEGRTPAEDRKTRPNVTWSPDSKAFYVSRTDSRGVQDLFLVDSIAAPRPRLEQYKYPMPGEEKVRKQELFYCDAAKKTLTAVKPKWKDERYTGVVWGKAANELRFIRRDRLQRNLAVCTIDVASGAEKCLLAESFDSAFLDAQPVRYVEETDELVWWSERTGWGHFYLYGRDGTFRNAITAGAWRASRIVEVDGKNKQLYFVGNAREPGENLYHTHLYRVRFDGTGLTLLDPSVAPAGGRYAPVVGGLNHQSYLSPTKKYVVTTASATDHAPVALVYDELGKPVLTLETTDLTRLRETGWRMPERFVVKAADGVTDLYGNVWKPFDFDPSKSYPVVANVYPGPQTEGVTHRFAAYSSTMQLAQLGFVVIQVGHRGGSPERSKAYHSFGYFNLRDYGLVDKKAAIEQLAARHRYIDLGRVGIYGHSGGGFMSAAAVLQPPYNDFFKAAVASAGNHDNNIYNDNWSERYHGMKEVAVADEKKDAATATAGTGATGTRTGGGNGGGRRRPPEVEAVEDEIEALLTGFDPDDRESVEEVEKKLAELQKKLADAKQAAAEAAKKEAEKNDAKKVDAAKTTDAAKGATQEKKAEEKAPPKTKFEIKVPTNAELAGNLKGHLMLVHGEIDNNVHPANTMRLADALIKANKRFDLLIIPGARHGFGPAQPYFTQRMWDFFAEHLLADRQTKADIHERDVKRR